MSAKRPPVNFSIMRLDANRLRVLKPVKVLDIYTNNTESFHPEGLFSTEIFGRVGSEERDKRFSFIDLKVEIFHPLYYKELIKLKRLYGEVISGSSYAVFDPKEKDLIKSDELTGQTGYGFFLSVWDKIVYKETDSHLRKSRIDFLNKYRTAALTRYVLVIPAGLRDMEMGNDGRTQEGEVNAYYRRLIGTANAVITKGVNDINLLNTARCSAQSAFNNIYNLYNKVISGKHGFIMSKWASRNVEHGTRSVLTGFATSNANLGRPENIGINNTLVGLFQIMKAIQPVVINKLMTGYLSKVFIENSTMAYLVDSKTLERKGVEIDSLTIDKWTTSTGLEKQISYFEDRNMRDKPIKVRDNYLALIYKGPDNTFKMFGGIEELPEELDAKYVKPITYLEFYYLCNFEDWNKIPLFVTRYPITGTGSIYPSIAYVKPTTTVESRSELGDDWQPTGRVAHFYPTLNPAIYIDSMGPHSSRIQGLSADYDGDTGSLTAVYTDDAVKEINDYLNSAKAYISTKQGLVNSPSVDPTVRVIRNMTGHPINPPRK